MPSNADDPGSSAQALSGARRFLRGIGELFGFLGSALVAVRDLWVAPPPEEPVTKGEDCDPPSDVDGKGPPPGVIDN